MIYKTPERNKPLAVVIDDDISMRLSMKAALAKAGFAVKEAESGHRGIELFEADRPDFILLDVVMPGINGFEACKKIRSMQGGEYVQILMVTGLDDSESIEQAFDAGANGFVSKPINWTMLGHRGKYMLRAGRAFQELNKSKSRLAKTQKLAKLGNWEIDLTTLEFLCSMEAHALLGIESKDTFLTYDDFFTTIIAEEKDSAQEQITAAIQTKKSFSVNYQVVHPDGSKHHILNQGEILFNEHQVAEIMLGAVQDVTQLKMAEEEIRILAFYDGLTGLANRMFFLNRLDLAITSAKRKKQNIALLYLDLDQFKKINDTFGHHYGDLLLKKVSETLQHCIRRTDMAARVRGDSIETVIARLGGDEFTVLLTDIKKPEHAAGVAKRILKAINRTYHLENLEIRVTTSIGISLFPSDGDDSSVLLKHADTAMYQAKNNGRNTYQFYVEALNVAAIERFSLERDIPKAIEREEFSLFFQPKIAVDSRRIVGAEALIRWQHPYRGMVPPDSFISIAEESGQIIAINQWVLETACKHWQNWLNDGHKPGIVAVNLSGYQLTQQQLPKNVEKILQETGFDPANLEIEITENILMQDTQKTATTLQQLQDMGIGIALDDFGTGYSSLSYLTSFQVDTLKIDRSFVMGCTHNHKSRIIIKAIIAMGHSMGMNIVAEGVENAEEFTLIKNLGVNQAQGFYFAPPMSVEEFGKLLADEEIAQSNNKHNNR